MTLDIGRGGIGLLALISLAFGIGAQLLLGRGHTRWMWLIGAAAWFVGGLIASEVVWGSRAFGRLRAARALCPSSRIGA